MYVFASSCMFYNNQKNATSFEPRFLATKSVANPQWKIPQLN